MNLNRRRYLGCVGAIACSVVSGCSGAERRPWRELSFGNLSAEESEGEWRIAFELVKNAQGPDEVETFHDVSVHAYDRDRAEVCTKDLGTIAKSYPGGNGLRIQMTCSAFPTMLTYSAAESPCDEEVATIISIAVYDDQHGWLYDRYSRGCGEGLPPAPHAELAL